MSPILVRPVREQLEHDRVIRLLQGKFRRRFDVSINPGAEQNLAVTPGGLYPDLVLLSQDRGRRPQVVIEVETGESVNHLEALAQWSHFSRIRPAFHLYVPSNMVEVARRLCTDNTIVVNEIWTYHGVGDELRFTLVHRTREGQAEKSARRPAPRSAVAKTARGSRSGSRPRAGARAGARPKSRSGTARKPVRGQKRK